VPVEVDATVGLGQVADRVNDVTISGGGNERVIRSGGSPAKIIVTAELGLGNLEVVPQGTLVTTGGTR
jgi:hypothetical protein